MELYEKKTWKRTEILRHLREQIKEKKPILMGAAGIGLVAKMEANAGIDLIMTTSADRFRMDGQPSAVSYLACRNANDVVVQNLPKIVRMTGNTPVGAGVATGDPYRTPEELVKLFVNMGASGMINAPAAAAFGKKLDDDVRGSILNSEWDYYLIKLCRKMDIFSAAYVFDEENARMSAMQGADLLVAHAGFTVGGHMGEPEEAARTMDEIITFTQNITEVVHRENPDAIVLCHGGMLNTPERVQECFTHTDVQGFLGCSAFDRLPIERAISSTIEELCNLPLKDCHIFSEENKGGLE